MPRISGAALSTVRIDVNRPTYLAIPDDIPPTLRNTIEGLVRSQKAGHFKPGDEYLLEAYAAAHLLQREAFEKIEEEGAIVDGKPSPWLSVLEKTGKALVSLSGRLRLCPQMRASARSLGRAHSPINSYGNPMTWPPDE